MSKALVIVVVVVVVVAEASIVDTPATIIAVVATVVDTASENIDSELTVLLFTYRSLKSFTLFSRYILYMCIYIFRGGGGVGSILCHGRYWTLSSSS